ncbi:hypothetical protein [Longispora fulva]|uniref:Uncharacterized protein n=1 Tax=Longispora fulva TaxID=619741 RepID=A0A8J7KUF4_9ACTN|nr:hypothetical protein [Longispora fulva]MBG6133982.1 hypothetical protein [Longispora fulva]
MTGEDVVIGWSATADLVVPPGPGVGVAMAGYGAPGGPGIGRIGRVRVGWLPGEAMDTAVRLARPGAARGTVLAVVVAPREVSVHPDWIAAALALGVAFQTADPQPRALVMSASAPLPPDRWVRVPHLVTISTGNRPRDRVVWELLPARVANERMAADLLPAAPVRDQLERYLHALLELRARLRTGQITNDVEHELAVLMRGEALTMPAVYRHVNEILALLTTTEVHEATPER